MNRMTPLIAALVCLVLLVTGVGCVNLQPVTDEVRYFMLTPAIPPVEGNAPSDSALAVGLAPVQVPAYLKRRDMAIAKSQHEVEYAPNLQWSEPLDKAVTQVMSVNLGRLLHTDRIFLDTWYDNQVQFELYVDLIRFEFDQDGKVWLEARWRITAPAGRRVLRFGYASITQPGPPPLDNPEQAVAGLSRALAELSRRIAASLSRLEPPQSPPLKSTTPSPDKQGNP